MTQEQQGTGDELWDEFVRQHAQSSGIHEPSAAERAAAAWRPRRRWRRWAMIGGVGLGVLAVVAGVGLARTSSKSPVASGRSTTSAGAAATRPAAAAPMVTEAQAFPAAVAGFTKVKQSGGPNCAGSGMVGPNLIAMIDQSKGCRGVIGALYKDAQKNEYTIVVFGMKDPDDVVHMVTALSMNPTDYEVGVLEPPTGSGLMALPADSGLVQAFAGSRGLMVVGLAQWSDGRAVDFQALTDKLQPLLDAVTKQAAAHDQG
ncbi:hypothetical protein [Streptacidiphilus neutrinimicus]|uniref:hypothetical protein n=1 Tax=Streptacidiphilus neutrinimicus TaxID=105420 RepID=UPI0005A60C6A|nr:hypothetical protein [Streptacidiphilus neutrinimicus]